MVTRYTPILIILLGLVVLFNGASRHNNSWLTIGTVLLVLGIVWTGARLRRGNR